MKSRKITLRSDENAGRGRTQEDFFITPVRLGFIALSTETKGPELTQERNKKQNLGLRS